MEKIGIIGGSGFIGSHTTKKFLKEGSQIKVSARDISKKEKYQHLWKLQNADNLQIQQLDVTNKEELHNLNRMWRNTQELDLKDETFLKVKKKILDKISKCEKKILLLQKES